MNALRRAINRKRKSRRRSLLQGQIKTRRRPSTREPLDSNLHRLSVLFHRGATMMRKLITCLAATAALIILVNFAGHRAIHATGSTFTGFPCPSNALVPPTPPFTCVMKGLDGVRGL